MTGALEGPPPGLTGRPSAAASSRRPATPSLAYTLWRWLFTVRSERNSRSAMSLLETPWAASRDVTLTV